MYCMVWHAEPEHNITCRMKFRGETLTSTAMSGPFNPPPRWCPTCDRGLSLLIVGWRLLSSVLLSGFFFGGGL